MPGVILAFPERTRTDVVARSREGEAQRAARLAAVPVVELDEQPAGEVLLADLLGQIARAALGAIGAGCVAVCLLLEVEIGLWIAGALAAAGGLCFVIWFFAAEEREEHHAEEAVARRLRIDGPPENAA